LGGPEPARCATPRGNTPRPLHRGAPLPRPRPPADDRRRRPDPPAGSRGPALGRRAPGPLGGVLRRVGAGPITNAAPSLAGRLRIAAAVGLAAVCCVRRSG